MTVLSSCRQWCIGGCENIVFLCQPANTVAIKTKCNSCFSVAPALLPVQTSKFSLIQSIQPTFMYWIYTFILTYEESTIYTQAYYAWLFSICKNPAGVGSKTFPLGHLLYVSLCVGRSWCSVCVCLLVLYRHVCLPFPNLGAPARALRSHPLERHDRAPVFGNGCAGSDKQFKEESALM